MIITSGIMSSNSDNWATPTALFNKLNEEFNFNLDPCADDKNHKCARYYTKEQNGLSKIWTGTDRVFLNPPYGKMIKHWVKKARQSYEENGALVVALLPARTDTKWWLDCMASAEIRFIKGRVKFGDGKNGAPFPSVIVIWRERERLNAPIVKMMEY